MLITKPQLLIGQVINMLVKILKIKSSYQVIKITLIVVMDSQHQPVQLALDAVELLIGQEPEVHIIVQIIHPIIMTVVIGLVLLTATAPAMRGVSVTTVPSTATMSATRASVFAPVLQSTLRRLRSNNQKSIPPLIKNKRGGAFVLNVKSTK